MTTPADYAVSVKFQLSELFINNTVKRYVLDWNTLQKELRTSEYVGKQIMGAKKLGKAYKEIESLIEINAPGLPKAKFIFEYLQKRIKWNGYSDIYLGDPKKVLKENEGSSGDINLILIAMLRESGINANPVFLSKRDHGMVFTNIPFLEQFNHVVVRSEIGDTVYFLDASQKQMPFGYISTQALGREGMWLKADGFEWIDLPAGSGADVFSSVVNINEDLSVNGKIEAQYKDYNTIPERRMAEDDKRLEKWKDRLKGSLTNLESVESELIEENDQDNVFSESVTFSGSGNVQNIGDFYYVSPILHSAFSENMFQSVMRYFPMDFSYPFKEKHIITVNVPEQYVIDQIPESITYLLPDKTGRFQYACEFEGNAIKIMYNLSIDKAHYNKAHYSFIRKMFILVEEKLNEQIVLKNKL
jgi:hypothetical protein